MRSLNSSWNNARDKKAELLSPAGSFDAARAAVNAGADAIYMGGPRFSARAYAESSGKDMLSDSIEFCHLRGVRVYMALNTLITEREFGCMEEYLGRYADQGIDACIVQDPGIMLLVKESFPGLRLHISTQAVVTGPGYAGLLLNAGADRIVLARELSLGEIKKIYDVTGAETEVFAHGAMCFSYSGQCLMSSMIGGRSGNRGRCAGTCRLPFDVYRDYERLGSRNKKYLLSMKDLNTLGRLTEMLDAGVYSFKIEGRMKSPEYTAAVTSVYRKYLDLALKGKIPGMKTYENDCHMLRETFDRGGETSGYLDGASGPDMIAATEKDSMRKRDEDLISEIRKRYLDTDRRHPVRAEGVFKKGEHPRLIYRSLMPGFRDIYGAAEGGYVIEQAKNSRMTREDIERRLSKLGDYGFGLSESSLEMESDVFLPAGILNELRRSAASELKKKILGSYHGKR